MLDREKTRQALEDYNEFYHRPDEAYLSWEPLFADVARAFVEGRLIDRETINIEAALKVCDDECVLEDEHPVNGPTLRLILDAALGENQ